MRIYYAAMVAILPVTVSIYGCSDIQTSYGNNNKEVFVPGASVGATHPNHRVAYVWSHDCRGCGRQFRQDILWIYLTAAAKKQILFSFLEYEEKEETVEKYTLDAICNGREFYQWYTLGFLGKNLNMDQIRRLADDKNVKYDICSDKESVRHALSSYFPNMKRLHPEINTSSGTIILDGRVVRSSSEIQRAIAE